MAYVRFWFVKLLVRMNPLLAFAGTPLYVLYLRALGARIGRNVLILSPHVPVCTDLLTIGDNAIVRKDSYFLCYRAHAGVIETGSVRIGRNAFVGEMTVLDIDTSLATERRSAIPRRCMPGSPCRTASTGKARRRGSGPRWTTERSTRPPAAP